MDSDRVSLDLLSHFDRPKTISLAEYREQDSQPPAPPGVSETRDVAAPQEPPAEPGNGSRAANRNLQGDLQRDARWILKWATAFAVIAVAASQLIAFAYLCQAEHALTLAARAGAAESILPRATCDTVRAAIGRRLTSYPQLGSQLQVTILQNGKPVGRKLQAGEDDRFSITMSAPASSLVPNWLAKLPQWKSDQLITARVERTMPSRTLRPEHCQTAAE